MSYVLGHNGAPDTHPPPLLCQRMASSLTSTNWGSAPRPERKDPKWTFLPIVSQQKIGFMPSLYTGTANTSIPKVYLRIEKPVFSLKPMTYFPMTKGYCDVYLLHIISIVTHIFLSRVFPLLCHAHHPSPHANNVKIYHFWLRESLLSNPLRG